MLSLPVLSQGNIVLTLIILFAAAFSALALINFRAATFILICLFPAYLIRFNFGPLPSTAFEIAFAAFVGIWLVKYGRNDYKIIKAFFFQNRWFAGAFLFFFLASIISIFISDMWWYSFGQWRAYFLAPMILFLIFIGRREMLDKTLLIAALSFSTLSISIFGIFQKLTGFSLPTDGRATSFFSSPNAVGLYLGPVIMLTIFLLIYDNKNLKKTFFSFQFWILILSLAVIFFTRSLGTILALFSGILILLWLLNKRKLAAGTLILLIIAGALFSPVLDFVTSKNQSSVNRLVLWQYSTEYLTASPKNFIFGTGIRQFFRKVQKPHYDVKQMERLIYPHNIFLNFWTETGLLGLLSFGVLYGFLMTYAVRIYRQNQTLGACLLSALAILLFHGLIDVPYFKNDLAMLFWTIAALVANTNEV